MARDVIVYEPPVFIGRSKFEEPDRSPTGKREALKVGNSAMKGKNQIYLKTCRRCQGDLYLDRDRYGPFATCLQCGHIYEANNREPALAGAGSRRLAA